VKNLDAAVKAALKRSKEMFELLRGLILGFGLKYAAVVRLVIDKFDHIAVAISIIRSNWIIQLRKNHPANAIDWHIFTGILL
jgi:hypothetical protein